MKKQSIIALILAGVMALSMPVLSPAVMVEAAAGEYEVSGNEIGESNVSENTISVNSAVSANTISRTTAENPQTPESPENPDTPEEDGKEESIEQPVKDEVKIPVLDPVSITELAMKTYKSVTVSWTILADAKGYELYRSTKKNKKYVLVKDITNGSIGSYTDKTKKLLTGTKYYYKVKAYAYDANGQKIYGTESEPKKITYSVPAVKLNSVKPVANGGLKLKWGKVKGADGYEIYRSKKVDGKYKKFKTVESGSVKSYTADAKSVKGSYYYKIRAYRMNGNKKVYGAYSEAKGAEVASLAHDGENFAEKCMRVFGTTSYKPYATERKALQNMTMITVKVWDFDSTGEKVTKTKTIQIHKNLALTVEQIFKEIYEGKERFPIKAVGGFSWRGDGSTSEHNNGTAIDINPNENYMIEGNGTISSGSYWRPGTDPYSIAADSEVVKIFQKYGFRWGGIGWSSGRKDYMHFSYFGT